MPDGESSLATAALLAFSVLGLLLAIAVLGVGWCCLHASVRVAPSASSSTTSLIDTHHEDVVEEVQEEEEDVPVAVVCT